MYGKKIRYFYGSHKSKNIVKSGEQHLNPQIANTKTPFMITNFPTLAGSNFPKPKIKSIFIHLRRDEHFNIV